MEEEKSNGAAISDTAIISTRTGLMGPLAGIDNSAIQAALVPLIISIFIPMAERGNVIGNIGPLALYTVITLYISWILMDKSYTLRCNPILSLLKDGKIKQVIYSVNVLGMMMMGALSANYVKIVSPVTPEVTGGAAIVL